MAASGSERIRTEALITDVQVPEVDPEVVRRDIGFLVGVDRYGMYVISVCIGVYFARDSGDYVVLLGHTG